MRSNATVTVVTLIVNLQVLNVSVDPVDHTYGYEDTAINEIESCVELVLEHILQRNDAVTETNEHDGTSGKPHMRMVYIFNEQCRLTNTNSYEILPAATFGDVPCTLTSRSLPIVAPPPKA